MLDSGRLPKPQRPDSCAQTDVKKAILEGHLIRLLDESDAREVFRREHMPLATLGLLSQSVRTLEVTSEMQRSKLDSCVSSLTESLGKCERIFKTPIPRVYTRHTTRFLAAWLFSLPLGVYSSTVPHWSIIPAIFFVSIFVLGIEELANVLEEPFSILPLTVMNNGIEANVFESLEMADTADMATATGTSTLTGDTPGSPVADFAGSADADAGH